MKVRLSADDLNADEKIQLTKSYWFDQLKPEVQNLIDAGDQEKLLLDLSLSRQRICFSNKQILTEI